MSADHFVYIHGAFGDVRVEVFGDVGEYVFGVDAQNS